MAELGSGNGSSYPGSLDTNNTSEVNSQDAGKTKARAEVPNDHSAAIVAIQTELGIDPAGTLTDVKTYLQTEHGTNGTHDATKVAMLAGTQTVTGDKTLSGTTTLSGASTISGVATFSGAPVLNGTAWPSFSADLNANQSVPDNTLTKITIDTEQFDTNSDYDNATNYRFTPTVAGKYLITCSIRFNAVNPGDEIATLLYKNGAEYARSITHTGVSGGAGITPTIAIVVDANGSTDYFEMWGLHVSGVAINALAGTGTYFTGCRIG